MKILQLVPSLASGGAERFVVDLSNQLVNDGHKVVLCTLNDNSNINFNKQFLDSKVEYNSFNIKGVSVIRIILQICKFIKDLNPDVVHCHLAVLQYIFPICISVSNRIKIFHTIHNMPKYASGGGGWHKVFFKLLYRTNRVIPITIAEECHKSYMVYYKLNNDVLIENGVSKVKPTENYIKVRNEIEKYKLVSNTPVFIHVARYNEQKNQRLLINAFNELNDRNIDFILLVIGRGFDSGEGGCLKRIACDKIFFLGEKNNVCDYLLCADYFCLTSIYEGLPISLIEALSVGVTPVCTAVGGIKNVIQDTVNGYLCNVIDQKSYVEVLKKALINKLDKNVLIDCYNKKYSMDMCMKKYVSLFDKTLVNHFGRVRYK